MFFIFLTRVAIARSWMRPTTCTPCPFGYWHAAFCQSWALAAVKAVTFGQLTCGGRCNGGLSFPCGLDTYNPLVLQSSVGACLPCPPNSLTKQNASTSRADCICADGFFNANASLASEPINMMAAVVYCQEYLLYGLNVLPAHCVC